MNNLKVLIYIESRYKVNRKRVKKAVSDILSANSVTSPVEVSIAIIGDRKMRSLNKKYRSLDKTTNVLSFPQGESSSNPKFISGSAMGKKEMSKLSAPAGQDTAGQIGASYDNSIGGISRLGDIVISYPQVIRESARDEMLVDDKIDELVKHSMNHLLGIHHT